MQDAGLLRMRQPVGQEYEQALGRLSWRRGGIPLNKSDHISVAYLTKRVYTDRMSCDAPFTNELTGTAELARLVKGAGVSAETVKSRKVEKFCFQPENEGPMRAVARTR